MFRVAFCLTLLIHLGVAATTWAELATVTIDTTTPGSRLNPRMYGIFLEEINHGVDGGLYAELVRNRGFEDARAPEGYIFQNGHWVDEHGFDSGFTEFGYVTDGLPFWSLIRQGEADGSMHLETAGGITAQSSYCVRLDATKTSDGRIGVANHGFFGIGLRHGERYSLSLYARGSAGYRGPLSVCLEDASGTLCSDVAVLRNIWSDWERFTATLTASKDEPKARLLITSDTPGQIWLDFVSLFPETTWRDHPNGLRADIAQMIADLKPGFVRFPGGCVVEGGTVETAYNWKLTVGRLEERQERWGPWNYRRTQGMGLHEYLQFCSDLRAEPLWVGFCGQTCIFRRREHVPMSEMGWVRDNFLDLVEYANGPNDSKWGKMRADAGRPEPFGLKLVEIGNENQGREYFERYELIQAAMKAKYPDLEYLADLSWTSPASMRRATFDIEDRHFYNTTRWFLSRFHEYDDRDRNLAPLYLGEVAVTSDEAGPMRGNLFAALAEGAFLMGCERNADVVQMVSYAPLLAHIDGRTALTGSPPPWHAMIYFDGTRVFGTVSYYLWKLFSEHRPDQMVDTRTEFATAGPPAIAGQTGLGTWDATAEFREVRIERDGEVLASSDFADGTDGWEAERGRWNVDGGSYHQTRRGYGLSYFGNPEWSNYTLTLKARKLSGGEGFLIVFGRQGADKYWWNLGGWGNTQHAIEMNQNVVGRPVRGTIEANRWYDIKIQLSGNHIRCYLDGKLIHDGTSTPTPTFFVDAGRDETTGEIVLKAINTAAESQLTNLRLLGTDGVASDASLIVLTSERLSDNNSLGRPESVIPVETRIGTAGTEFTHEFPPHSLTIMRLKTTQN